MNLVDSLRSLELSETPRERVNDPRSAKRSRFGERAAVATSSPNPDRFALLITNVYHKALSRQNALQAMLQQTPALSQHGPFVEASQKVQSIVEHCLHCNALLASNTPANIQFVFSQKGNIVSSYIWLYRTE